MPQDPSERRRPDGLDWHGRRKGKALRAGQQARLEAMLPALRIADPAHPEASFAGPIADLWLEIGFGGGEHLAAQARAHPEIGLIGCEPFVNGIVKLLAQIEADAIANVRLHDEDARPLLGALPEACLGRVFVLFADPWPKARHRRRRFIEPGNLDRLARVMKDGAVLRFASDHAGYAAWALERLLAHADFEWTAERAADWRHRPADAVPTRYENKALAAGRRPAYLNFRRRRRPG